MKFEFSDSLQYKRYHVFGLYSQVFVICIVFEGCDLIFYRKVQKSKYLGLKNEPYALF